MLLIEFNINYVFNYIFQSPTDIEAFLEPPGTFVECYINVFNIVCPMPIGLSLKAVQWFAICVTYSPSGLTIGCSETQLLLSHFYQWLILTVVETFRK